MKPPRTRFRRSFPIGLFTIFPLTILLLAETADFDGRPAIVLRNDKIELTILIRGAMLANFVLRDRPERLSPYWNSTARSRFPARVACWIARPFLVSGRLRSTFRGRMRGWDAVSWRGQWAAVRSSGGVGMGNPGQSERDSGMIPNGVPG
jgi:hypothetical protein